MTSLRFPEKFLWGSATSAHQVEGANTLNDWWEWEKKGRVPEKSGQACQHYERFAEDFDTAKSLHQNAHRFSLEWSRIEPRENEYSQSALLHYWDVVQALRERNLEPVVTLHHFTNPAWLSRKGGWEHHGVVEHFSRYVRYVVDFFGESVRYWITFNEPLVYVYQGYVSGIWPPGVKSFEKAIRVIRHQLVAHARAYRIIHSVAEHHHWQTPSVGFSTNFIFFAPCSVRSLADRLAQWVRHSFFNRFYLRTLTTGRLLYPGIFFEALPDLEKTLDFVGLNYYTRDFIHFGGLSLPEIFGTVCSREHHQDAGSRNALGWEIYPEGLYSAIRELAKFRLPILITENGICTEHDEERWFFIRAHLAEAHRAIQEGANVLGYFYWSLLDNFEWAEGFRPRFGLVAVDFKTQRRTVRPSALQYADVCRTGELHLSGLREVI
ncbi:MAG: glycoside hydrolase family 1 protein [Candidatus Omnitrophota bacterium]